MEEQLTVSPSPGPGEGGKASLFSNKDLFFLFLPLVIEQFLAYLVGLADSIMVAHVGEAAVSGVSLVDFIMQLLISMFSALATGGAVIAGQYLGCREPENARSAADQLIWFAGLAALGIMGVVYALKGPIFSMLFGTISPDVYGHASIYFAIVVSSIPFLALYNAGAAIFRTAGNANLPMKIMMAMNVVNVVGNFLCVYIWNMGTAGIAIPTLISRIGAAVIVLAMAARKTFAVRIQPTFRHKFNGPMIRRILSIGIPFGLENGLFHMGRIVVLSLVSTFGTAAIAANSVSSTIVMFQVLPGMSIGLGLTVIISRCVGQLDYDQAKYFTKKIMLIIYVAHLITSVLIIALLPVIFLAYDLSAQATSTAHMLIIAHAVVMCLIWPLAYTLPITFRAAGDAKYPMAVSISSMVLCRIAMAYLICRTTSLGMPGTWVAMFIDWAAKAILFTVHYLRGKWMLYRSI